VTPESTGSQPVIYHIDGRKITSANDFYREIGSAVNGPGGYFGRNLDALADCLRGGFGTPEQRPYEFEWQHSALSQGYLNKAGPGKPSLFDKIRDVFKDAGVPLRLR
jgi:RNAse (barnase) inhibitor barstar